MALYTSERPGAAWGSPGQSGLRGAPAPLSSRRAPQHRRRRREGDGHVNSLDGIRAFAVLSVMAYHLDFVRPPGINPLHPIGGWLGVDVFFVLSGYLITSLLIKEYGRRRRISFGGFWVRRALRLFPALAVMLTVVGLICAHNEQYWWAKKTIHTIPWVVGYAINWGVVVHNSNVWAGAIANTWSLAVEEQFYVVWPLVCLLLLRYVRNRRAISVGLVLAAGYEVWWRRHLLLHGASFYRLYNGSDTHSDSLLIGCALAFFVASLVVHERDWWRYLAWAGAALGVAAAPFLYLYADYGPRWTWEWIPGTAVATALILFSLVTHPLPPLRAFLAWRPLVWVGKRSYGLYLWHLPVIVIASSMGFSWKDPSPLYRTDLVLITLTVTALSYRLVEQPFLGLKDRLGRRQHGEGVLPQPAEVPVAEPRRGRRRVESTFDDVLPQGYVANAGPAGASTERPHGPVRTAALS